MELKNFEILQENNDTIVSLQLKIEEKLNRIPDDEKTDLEDVISYNDIVKKGKSLDYHMIQGLITWLHSTES
ncbi:hypothetical protein CLU96_3507 [Chryseobacterium sp. 52]|uniref:hypothetical protein n=1 Tax=Chryseobacterium sp. 52 TaxID=2035213 RepID=UPI000C177ABA|nr:hypothetical protein [Chryseobacterium sp. 52]PIF46471.1 hypothetical protein CLU96_3507 [Chryseobacterium sp. 52]